ncbi:MAG: thioredoxin-disulfide reductase [Paludibacteraceae bacterium]|nr:thioredoxin-disulfide reductase [Paludibacteraceae bacterium]
MERIDMVILGSGPAGMTAALYGVRFGLKTVVYEGMQPGGQLTTTSKVENYPGFVEGIDGGVLVDKMKAQAERFGAEVRYGSVTKIEKTNAMFVLTIDGEEKVEAGSVIVATGASAKYLGLPREEEMKGRGVSTCATCDGFFHRGKVVAVVGGGDSALEEALYLSKICKEVHLVVRKSYMRAANILQDRVRESKNIIVHLESNVTELLGEMKLTAIKIQGKDEAIVVEVSGLFEAVGHNPNTEFLKGMVEMDAAGYIQVSSPSTRTSVEGMFAAGDVADSHYQQGINAAASGCRAAFDARDYLQSKSF